MESAVISNAYAQAANAPTPGGFFSQFGIILLMFVLMYFMLIRPQMKRAKEQKAMVEALSKGDEVIAAGGVLGKITKVGDTYITLEIAPNTEVVVQKAAVQTLLPKGTVKSA